MKITFFQSIKKKNHKKVRHREHSFFFFHFLFSL